ncbi:MAG: hypothetical protein RL656_366, partial [Bacteroidota bacterium]
PDYYLLTKDSSLIGDADNKDNWFNLQLPSLNGSVHFSYYPITKVNQLDKLVNDAFKMAHFHNKKANYIDEVQLNISPDVTGIEFHTSKAPRQLPINFTLRTIKNILLEVFFT